MAGVLLNEISSEYVKSKFSLIRTVTGLVNLLNYIESKKIQVLMKNKKNKFSVTLLFIYIKRQTIQRILHIQKGRFIKSY